MPTFLACRPSHCPRAALLGFSLPCVSVWGSGRAPVYLLSRFPFCPRRKQPPTRNTRLTSLPCPVLSRGHSVGGGWPGGYSLSCNRASCAISQYFSLRIGVCWVGRLEPFFRLWEPLMLSVSRGASAAPGQQKSPGARTRTRTQPQLPTLPSLSASKNLWPRPPGFQWERAEVYSRWDSFSKDCLG